MEYRIAENLKNIERIAKEIDTTKSFALSLPKWQWKRYLSSARFLRKLKPYIVADKGYIETKDLSAFLDDIFTGSKDQGLQQHIISEFKRRVLAYYKSRSVKWIHMAELESLLPLEANVLMKYRHQSSLSSVDFAEIYHRYDVNNSGVLDYGEVQGFVYDLLINKKQRNDPRVLEVVAQEILKKHAKENPRKLTMTEMAQMLNVEKNFMTLFTGQNSMSQEQLDCIFQHYDKDNDGFVEGLELQALVNDLLASYGKNVDKNIVESYTKVFLREADTGGCKKISKEALNVLFASRRK